MKPFEEIGAHIEAEWRRASFSEQVFPAIAEDALAKFGLIERVDPWDIVRWVHSTSSLPEQNDREGRFGDPPVTLFNGSRFYIDVYFWLDGTTTIHQHAFSGAFQVLLGSSVHSQYDFRDEQAINEHFSVGEVRLRDVELLTVGDIRRILPGAAYIHSLFHLDRPSATIAIRTEHTPSSATQYDYLKPSIAVDQSYQNQTLLKRVQTASLLLAMKHKDADAMIGDLIEASDFHTAYLVLAEAFRLMDTSPLEALFDLPTGRDRFNRLLERARAAHGALVDLVGPVLAERTRQNNIIARRAAIRSEDHRFLLALLLNVPAKERIVELVKRRFPDRDPVACILGWVDELARTTVFGSPEVNVLGIDDFGNQHAREIERSLTRGGDPLDAECVLQLKRSILGPLM